MENESESREEFRKRIKEIVERDKDLLDRFQAYDAGQTLDEWRYERARQEYLDRERWDDEGGHPLDKDD